ncbi:MAG: hypothetical protein KatS3mg011_2091 [Acidimicrobiia bacterium]|nr:MAG: hypothetical protein KatS3mg011_2091 [Acidimicrobiia bacterium]
MGDPADALAEIYRREVGRCTATLIRVLGHIDLAEDAVAEAFAIAAEQWPTKGIPPNPGGWIITTARNRAIDRLRRESKRDERHLAAHRIQSLAMDPEPDPELDELDALVEVVPDDQLRLTFLCCHPALAARSPGGAHTATGGRTKDLGNRSGLPRPRIDDGPAPGAGQA